MVFVAVLGEVLLGMPVWSRLCAAFGVYLVLFGHFKNAVVLGV